MAKLAAEVHDIVESAARDILKRVDHLTDEQALSLAHVSAILYYKKEIECLKEFRERYKKLVDRVRFEDAVMRKIKLEYDQWGYRITKCERHINYLEEIDYKYKATKKRNLRDNG